MLRLITLGATVMLLTSCTQVSEDARSACTSLTAEEASRIIGVEITEVLPTGSGNGCSYGNPGTDATTVLFHYEDEVGDFEADKQLASDATVVTPLNIGEEAFAYDNAGTQTYAAEALSNRVRFRIVVRGPDATLAKAEQALRTVVDRGPIVSD